MEDDPWTWDIDRVVRELCTNQRSWPAKSASQRLPDPASLEECLREQEVDGPTLLTTVNETILKETLGVRKLREIDTINHAIMALRSMSPSYRDWQRKYGRFGDNSSKRSLSPDLLSRPDASPTPSLLLVNKRRKLTPGVDDDFMHPPILIDDTPTADDSLTQPIVSVSLGERHVLHENTEAQRNGGLGEVLANGKKRKRIAPTLVTSAIDPSRNREIPTQADVVVQNDPHNIEPGIIYRGDDGKKRLIPLSTSSVGQKDLARRHQDQLHLASSTLQRGSKGSLEAAEEVLLAANFNKTHPECLSVGYLGKNKSSVDSIFYGNAALNSELCSDDGDEEFSHVRLDVSNARRLYVNKLMRHYLRVQPQVVIRKDTRSSIVQPYHIRLVPKFTTPSLTVFRSKETGKAIATRESLKKWPEVDPYAPKDRHNVQDDEDRCANFHLPDGGILGGPNSYDDWDPSLHLEKYMHLEGGDHVLPLYGDSDEDGEYDIETWREIEEELGTLEKPRMPLTRQHISQDEISQAIDEGIALMVIKWNNEKLPKRQPKAWNLWRKCHRDKSFKRQRIREAQQHLDRINNQRLVKMRLEILSEVWTSQKQVRKQSRIMEQSIFDREDLVWQISVLESKTEPARPPRDKVVIKPKRPVHEHREDEESIESETETEISDDGLDGFIVEDNVASIDEEICTADENFGLYSDLQEEHEKARMNIDSSDEEATLTTPSKPALKPSPKTLQDLSFDEANGTDAADELKDEMSSPAQTPNSQHESDLPSLPFRGVMPHSPRAEVIDLTILSSDTSAAEPSQSKGNPRNLNTPEKHRRSLKLKLNRTRLSFEVAKENSPSKSANSMITISDSDEVSLPNPPPPLHDFAAIAKFPYRSWAKSGDQERFLIAFFQQMRPDIRDTLRDLFESVEKEQMWINTMTVMDSFPKPQKVRGMDESTFKTYTGVIRLFEMFLDGEFRPKPRGGISLNMVTKLKAESDTFPRFHEFCRTILAALNQGNMHQVFGDRDHMEENDSGDGDEEEIRPAIRRKSKLPE